MAKEVYIIFKMKDGRGKLPVSKISTIKDLGKSTLITIRKDKKKSFYVAEESFSRINARLDKCRRMLDEW